MHKVTMLELPTPLGTTLWVSEKASKEMSRFFRRNDPKKAFRKALFRGMENGFQALIGTKVVSEGNGIFRFGIEDSLFRLIGFFNNGYNEFIVIETLEKSGQKLSRPNMDCINRVAKVKEKSQWFKENDE